MGHSSAQEMTQELHQLPTCSPGDHRMRVDISSHVSLPLVVQSKREVKVGDVIILKEGEIMQASEPVGLCMLAFIHLSNMDKARNGGRQGLEDQSGVTRSR